MTQRLRVHNYSISVDGFCAGPDQSPEQPMGRGGMALHTWALATRSFHRTHGQEGGVAGGVDDDLMAAGVDGVGATIMGRNMFGPVRGPWPDASWRGWWGETPPFGHPVFVLTHHARPSFATADGNRFHFVTDGPEAALARAREAAAGADVRLGGGAATVAQFLARGLVDHLHLAVAPVLLGAGERPWPAAAGWPEGYRVDAVVMGEGATHITLVRDR